MLIMDKLCDDYLNISTMIDENESLPERKIYSNYVPTSYNFLEKVFTYFPFEPHDHLVDFGCGKGRVLFLAALNLCKHVTGYEIDETRLKILANNIENYQNKFGNKTLFSIHKNAENMNLNDIKTANKYFFFHPFNLKIYMKVINNLLSSINDNPRNILIYLYMPYPNIVEYLDTINILHREVFMEANFVVPHKSVSRMVVSIVLCKLFLKSFSC